ncbi:bifunctional ADP-dependent NAD(P)H-hydrate dehydratase/NAD(P)H-hydrate epimerase [Puerhibacterium sp. TATVAM-FAB25]|uniref:bifunctional ADP-dependent NAD(P)H-hydrate dehydratase/NAD(P)H-hydrate epimerase n=1 Tax=Puerhibacterium sp. TATVAM-FAB25 TaxID=3093699 RepID=UPI00397E5072
MIEAWDSGAVRAAERPLLDTGVPLMERAAFALAVVVVRDVARRRATPGIDGELADGPVRGARAVLLVGAGNNGGDALHAGAHLAVRGMAVTALLVDARAHAGGLAALRRAGGRVVPLHEPAGRRRWDAVLDDVAAADVVLDGLVGIGAQGPLRGLAAELVAGLRERLGGDDDRGGAGGGGAGGGGGGGRPWVVAVDAPSGIGVDDGTVPGPVLPADRTVTFGAAKPGLLLPPATHLTGRGAVVDLGLDLPAAGAAVARLEDADVARAWPVPGPTDHKYTRGVVGVVAGTATYPGAAVLASSAAVHAGAGMVRYLGPEAVGRAVVAARPEVVTATGRVQAWVLGSGLPAEGPDDGQRGRARAALAAATGADEPSDGGGHGPVPVVADAGALGLLDAPCPPWVVVTPHAGELATLLSARGEDVERADVEAEPLRWARRAHELLGATVLLKGGATVVVGPGGAYAQADAPGWLATAGAGDVLAGLLGTMLAGRSAEVVARPERAAEVAAAAALVHGRAAERANPGGPVAALDVAGALPATVAGLLALR